MHKSVDLGALSFFLLCALPFPPNTALSPSFQAFMQAAPGNKVKLALKLDTPSNPKFSHCINLVSHIASLNLNHLIKRSDDSFCILGCCEN